MLIIIKWLCLLLGVVYAVDNVINRIKGYGVDFSRKFLVVGGFIGFFVCQLWEVFK